MRNTWNPLYNQVLQKYEVLENGSIWSKRYGKILTVGRKDSNGYIRKNFYVGENSVKHTISIHRLVAYRHIYNPNPSYLNSVDHIKPNKDDNSKSNLQWMNNLENTRKGNRLC